MKASIEEAAQARFVSESLNKISSTHIKPIHNDQCPTQHHPHMQAVAAATTPRVMELDPPLAAFTDLDEEPGTLDVNKCDELDAPWIAQKREKDAEEREARAMMAKKSAEASVLKAEAAKKRQKDLKAKADAKRKKAQIEEVEPERMVTMCATCRTQLEEGLEEFNMDIPVVGLTEMIADHLVEKGPPKA